MNIFLSDEFPQWQKRIKMLLETAWIDSDANEIKIDRWLANFRGDKRQIDEERRIACHLLQQFIYFGKSEVEESMRVLFRDHFIYPAVQELRTHQPDIPQLMAALKSRIVNETRFIGMGLPAESGTGMLYRFRIANDLPLAIFPELNSILKGHNGNITTNPSSLKRIIIMDDLCATGEQVEVRMGSTVNRIRTSCPHLKVDYFLLFATARGVKNCRQSGLFNEVAAAIIFDDDYQVFSPSSLFYKEPIQGVSAAVGEEVCGHYGGKLKPLLPLGFRNSQLLIGFEHNTPDNTLPVFWKDDDQMPWHAVFPRVEKH
ncbi:MAG: hypothetical protein U1F61_03875 [Opitutaceae bacterium]